ncbi:hypothetical protein ACSSS7_005765 [Eimeria intestinalis]
MSAFEGKRGLKGPSTERRMNAPTLPDRPGQLIQRNDCRLVSSPIKNKKAKRTSEVPISTSTPGFLALMMTELPSTQVDWHELISAASALVSSAPTLGPEDNFASLEGDIKEFNDLGIMFDFHAALAPEDPSTPMPNAADKTRHRRSFRD